MATLAIKGHPTRGKEVIEILEMLGGKNRCSYFGESESYVFYIIDEIIDCDEIRYLNDYIIYTLEGFLEKFPYKVGDRVRIAEYESEVRIDNMKWDGNKVQYEVFTDMTEWYSAEELNLFNEPYKEETMGEIKIDIPAQYPKTYEECCGILDNHPNTDYVEGYKWKLMMSFQKLLICRDAYWKIAGEQMGLGKPWKPEKAEIVHAIFYNFYDDVIDVSVFNLYDNVVLCFPTEEMRDVFYENFKDLIMKCKELL
ncbi:MAG: hypothetical protein IIW42_07825 [Bacteroidaceae bacterium]|nr:hypothetical protein [Bacteroidaceae bacterium]